MTQRCKQIQKDGFHTCGSYAFNLWSEGIEQGDLCDVHFWQQKAQRPWVGLTDEEKHEIELKAGITEDDDGYIVSQVFKLIEAKLKEKNT
jgi:hypothetical protein